MRATAVIFLTVMACESSSTPDTTDTPDASQQDASAPEPSSLYDQLTMFFPLDESGEGTRVDSISEVALWPWQRVGPSSYDANARGTTAVAAAVGDGQHVLGSDGYHFSTGSAPAMNHANGSFTWAGWASIDAPDGDNPYADDQTWVGKWNDMPDTIAPIDHREYRVFYDAAREQWRFEASADGLSGDEHSTTVTHPTSVERERLYFLEAWHDADADTLNLRVSTREERGEVASVAWDKGVFAGDADLNVGAQNTCTDDHLQGVIDALGHWTRTLSDDESRALWNDGAGLEL